MDIALFWNPALLMIDPMNKSTNESTGESTTVSTVPPAVWYIVKQPEGYCDIVPAADLYPEPASPSQADGAADIQQWGPFASQSEAIARRVGLIRAGKCLPR